ncbi:MAG: hypothetical protein E7374_01235 [Clostridiales bacterium]|nr:hypothetical protein [Clostridiales bacterium]
MNKYVNVIMKEDGSVDKVLQKTADKLRDKYTKKRKINEKILNFQRKNAFTKTVSIIFDIICVLMVAICAVLCFASINSRFQNIAPTFAGYSSLRVSSESMVASGFDVGDNIIVRSIDTDTLKVGDKIAFYRYPKSYNSFDLNTCIKVNSEEIKKHDYKTKPLQFIGMQSKSIRESAKANSKLIFHEIINVYEDDNGTRWFQTKGTSNNIADPEMVEEKVVLGIYDDSKTAKTISHLLGAISSNSGLITFILIPLGLMALIIVIELMKDIQVAKLECDVVEEKRKLTDEICVKNNIGFNMDKKTKLKVLATAPDDKKKEYIALLWKDGKAPESIKKYYIRRQVQLAPIVALRDVNRKCEEMYKNNVSMNKIAKYYRTERAKIEEKADQTRQKLKEMEKKKKQSK